MAIVNTRVLSHPVNYLVVLVVLLFIGVTVDLFGQAVKRMSPSPGDALAS